jgi:hypothetical protein
MFSSLFIKEGNPELVEGREISPLDNHYGYIIIIMYE